MTATPRPTSVRYLIVGVTALAAVLLYLDRVCISFTAIYVQQDLGLTQEEMSYALGAFFFAYALAQVPGGWLGDRFGARLTFTLCVLLWSAFTAGTALLTALLLVAFVPPSVHSALRDDDLLDADRLRASMRPGR